MGNLKTCEHYSLLSLSFMLVVVWEDHCKLLMMDQFGYHELDVSTGRLVSLVQMKGRGNLQTCEH